MELDIFRHYLGQKMQFIAPDGAIVVQDLFIMNADGEIYIEERKDSKGFYEYGDFFPASVLKDLKLQLKSVMSEYEKNIYNSLTTKVKQGGGDVVVDTPSSLVYACSIGYDLFELIPKGLAIEITDNDITSPNGWHGWRFMSIYCILKKGRGLTAEEIIQVLLLEKYLKPLTHNFEKVARRQSLHSNLSKMAKQGYFVKDGNYFGLPL